jgi:hypothetical protein
MGFLTSNLDALKTHTQSMEKAFSARAAEMNSVKDDEWKKFDVDGQEKVYSGLMDSLKASATGVEDLKSQEQMTIILERHIWAGWIRQQDKLKNEEEEKANEAGMASGSGPLNLDPNNPNKEPQFSLGGDVEDRLNAIGVNSDAGVRLSGLFFIPNSAGWKRKLYSWAEGYKEKVKK